GIKLARRMLVAPPLDSIYAGEFEPGADKTTDADIVGWLRGVVASDNHEVGSLSMMPQGLGGVVDTSLKVYGTANVRVADASIIPFPVSAHLVRSESCISVKLQVINLSQSSTVYMIGERVRFLSFACRIICLYRPGGGYNPLQKSVKLSISLISSFLSPSPRTDYLGEKMLFHP
ncbi:GMC oxidoreductase-domain-containing protein, partial [Mycena olivaceomarginata]